MEQITIRQATSDDVVQLQQISRQTFVETFAASNSEQNMQAYLEEGLSQPTLSAELLNPDSAFYFAEQSGTAIGYLKVNTGPAQTEVQPATTLEIERIYVLHAYHGQKGEQLLYEHALQLATQAQAEYVWLGVWEENQRAIRFYEKNGFAAFGTHVFMLGNDAQTDILMRRPVPRQG